jgi:hypothetical protein
MLTHPENFKSRHIYSIKKKLQDESTYDPYLDVSIKYGLFICLPQQVVMMSVFAQPDPVFDHGNNSVNI